MSDPILRVLLVDDDAEYASVVKYYLSAYHGRKFEVLWKDSGENLADYIKNQTSLDLLLLDYFIPPTDGLRIVQELNERKIDLPIILLTSNKDFKIAIEAMKFGVEEYLVKEETVDSMLPRAIVDVIDRWQLKKQIEQAELNKLISRRKTEAVQELVVTMCHEFNNPLAAIKISTDILSRQKIAEDERALLAQLNKYISDLEKQIIKLRDLTAEKSNIQL